MDGAGGAALALAVALAPAEAAPRCAHRAGRHVLTAGTSARTRATTRARARVHKAVARTAGARDNGWGLGSPPERPRAGAARALVQAGQQRPRARRANGRKGLATRNCHAMPRCPVLPASHPRPSFVAQHRPKPPCTRGGRSRSCPARAGGSSPPTQPPPPVYGAAPNVGRGGTMQGQSASEMLAWASAQIHCQFHASENRVALPPSDDSKHDVQAENETVFVPNRGERGQCILSTPPKILFCDLRLDPGESKSYSYCEVLPVDGPPSFRGQSVKYAYKLTVGCQRVNSPIKLLRVPFRVLVLHGLKDYQFPQDEAVAPSNPFLEEEEGMKKDPRLADLATELLMAATSRRSLHLYNISNTRGKVGKFCIFKTVYKIGEDVIGTFNFSEGDIPCLQYSVSLQTEESIQEEFQRRRGQPVSFSTHARHQESCLHTSRSSFSLPIPLGSTPGFITNIVSLKWRLHFEFVTSREPVETHLVHENQSETVTWSGVEQIDVDTFSWDLPIKVLPTNPVLASYVSPFSSTNSTTI